MDLRDLEHAQRDARNLVATLELRASDKPEMTLLHLAQAIGLATMVRDALMRTVADRFVYDVIATEIKTGNVRVIAENETEANAEAIVKMAVMRRGVEDEFFSVRAREETPEPTNG